MKHIVKINKKVPICIYIFVHFLFIFFLTLFLFCGNIIIENEMEERKMKNVYKVYNDCMKICLDLNIPVADFGSVNVEVNSRAKKRWGFVL